MHPLLRESLSTPNIVACCTLPLLTVNIGGHNKTATYSVVQKLGTEILILFQFGTCCWCSPWFHKSNVSVPNPSVAGAKCSIADSVCWGNSVPLEPFSLEWSDGAAASQLLTESDWTNWRRTALSWGAPSTQCCWWERGGGSQSFRHWWTMTPTQCRTPSLPRVAP